MSACVSIRQHGMWHAERCREVAYVSMRQHTSAYVSIRLASRRPEREVPRGSIRQHTSAYALLAGGQRSAPAELER
jgi:hypothetical protein